MRYAITVDVAVPRDELTALVDDPMALADWHEDLVAVEHLDGVPGQVGARTGLRYERGGHALEAVHTLMRESLPHELVVVDAANGCCREVRHEFEALGAYATRWTQHCTYAFTGPGMATLGALMPGSLARRTRREMRALKLHAEKIGQTVPEPLC